jgi:tryptophan-rich sensory protein
MKLQNILTLLGAIVITEGAGIIGSFFTTPSIPTWYAGLTKPALNPPSWVFGPVWTTLFLLMGIALFLVYQKGWSHHNVKVALIIFAVQLVLNVLWSILFFGLHSPGLAAIEIGFLWISILVTIIAFMPISRAAGLLLIPYILWVSFASYLNISIWFLN